jgi:mono/diheme cytochrome c family protein
MKRVVFVAIAMLAAAVVWSGGSVRAEQAAAAPGAPTFNKDIAPIFFANCTSCHRPGEVAPMSLMSYKDARPWAKAIATKVADGTMPPWHADPAYGKFLNERRLTDAQKATIAKWVSAGAPEGNAADLPPAPTYNDGWNIGTPDVVLSMQEDYPIPASGDVPYQYFEVPANFSEDRYIQSWEIRPGDRAAVHHIIVSTRPPKEIVEQQVKQQQQMMLNRMFGPKPAANAAPRPLPLFSFKCCIEIPAGQTGGQPLPPDQRKAAGPNDRPRPLGTGPSVGGYVPGNSLRRFPEGTAMRLPAGYSLVFQMHYTPYGKATTDRSKVALKFATAKPAIVLNTATLINGSLDIPPGAADHLVENEMTINRDVMLYSLVPHTHVRGKRWYYEAAYPDGRKEVLLSVPKYDFNWQHEYVFAQPLKMPAGTRILAKAWYDNSTANKSNPDPKAEVKWGDQTWEEMMYTSVTFFLPPTPPATGAQDKN